MSVTLQRQPLFTLDGTVPLATVGLTSGTVMHYLNNDNTIDATAGDATSWHKITCVDADTISICGSSQIIEKGGLTSCTLQQIRVVALGLALDDPDFEPPNATKANPASYTADERYAELMLEVWPTNFNTDLNEAALRKDTLSGEAARQGILPDGSAANGDVVHWCFKLSEPTSGLNATVEPGPIGRMEQPYITNIDVIYLAIGINHGGHVGNLTTTTVKTKISAVTRSFYTRGDR